LTQLLGSTRMAGEDATWLHMDQPENLMIVNTILYLDGPADWPAIEESFFERVVEKFAVFRSRAVNPPLTVGLIAPRWQRVEVRRADHIRSVTLPSPGGDAELYRYVSGEACRPLDGHVPLWQLHLIDGHGGGGVILLRSHHALGDGATLLHALDTWAGPSSEGSDASIDRLPGPERRTRQESSIGTDMGTLSKLVLGLPSKASVLGDDVGGLKSVASTDPVPLEKVKQLAGETNATVNDVCLALIAGALRHGVDGAAAAHVEAVIPVNIRSSHEPIEDTLGNRFGLVFVTLPTSSDDLRERIKRVKANMDGIKSSREARLVLDALTMLGATSRHGARAWIDAFSRRASVVITNIAGPQRRLRLGATEVRDMVLWVPTTGPIGLGVSICSYAGSLRFGVIADTAVMADPARFVLALEEQLGSITTDTAC